MKMPDNSHPLIAPKILHDLPLDPERSDDSPSFRFDIYANMLARLIANRETRTPLVISINGKWGSGKTTLLRLIQDKLETTRWLSEDLTKVSFAQAEDESSHFRQCRTIWFNAWKYTNEDSLLAALIRTILIQLGRGSFSEKIKKALVDPTFPRRDVITTFLSMFKLKIGDLGFEPDFDSYKTETPFAAHIAFFDHFTDAFDQLIAIWLHNTLEFQRIEPEKATLVVFIDDLDRCVPAKTIQVLEAVKLFLDKLGVVFVIGADEAIIRAAVEVHYMGVQNYFERIVQAATSIDTRQQPMVIDAQNYLDKIFQLHFQLPPLTQTQIEEYLEKLPQTSSGLAPDFFRKIDLIATDTETNLRRLKKAINNIELHWATLVSTGEIEIDLKSDFISWLILSNAAPDFCEEVKNMPKEKWITFVSEAVVWANGLDEVPNFVDKQETRILAQRYEQWESHARLRRALKKVNFSNKVNADVLEGFIFLSSSFLIEANSGTSDSIAEFVVRATERRMAQTPKAYLIALEGLGEYEYQETFEIYSQTSLGRSPHLADLCFHQNIENTPISRLHCTLLDEEDHFTIRDDDSVSGTYLNRVRLDSLEPVPLNNGDEIELAQVARGGIRFRFELAKSNSDLEFDPRATRQLRRSSEVKAYLLALEGLESLETFGISGEMIGLGRSPRDADLCFHQNREDSPVSRLHCTLFVQDDLFYIRDDDSANGTYLNRVKLNALETTLLNNGDEIELAQVVRGGIRFRFELANSSRDTEPAQENL
jgi:pSer/pThr/pTyr-binding forkhead associated (FHA) protein